MRYRNGPFGEVQLIWIPVICRQCAAFGKHPEHSCSQEHRKKEGSVRRWMREGECIGLGWAGFGFLGKGGNAPRCYVARLARPT